jgi:hypothetical protein
MSEAKTEEEKDREKRESLYKDFKTETEKRQISSSENFDKSVLTYASWALGISIAFLKDFIPIDIASVPCFLYLSWICFFVSIGLTTASFLLAYKSLEIALVNAYKYYIESNDDYLNKNNFSAEIVKWSNTFSGICFVLGLVFTLLFVSLNLEKAAMQKKATRNLAQDGMPLNLMTKVHSEGTDLQKGLPPSAMQKVSPPPPPPPQKESK